MTREQYIKHLLNTYQLVTVLADKNECRTLRVRHKQNGRDMVVHSYPHVIPAYEWLCTVRADNLPEIYDAVTLEDGQIVLEEYIDGLTIAQVMESGQYRYHGAKKVLAGVCDALSLLHQNGLVHRDIKPENIVIDTNGRVVLIDLNASRQVSASKKDTVVMGTVGYASPEQLGVSQSDARTDIYAAGVLLNVMVTGKHPSECIADGKAGRIVRRCTNVNPDDRYPTAEALKKSL